MNAHYRNYQILVNNKTMPFFLSVEAISTYHISETKSNYISEQIKLGVIKEDDNVEFIFKYCNS